MLLRQITKIILFIILIAVIGYFVFIFTSDSDSPSPIPSFKNSIFQKKTWMEITPVQCQQNPWEQWWITANPNETYPSGESNVIDAQEKTIIQNYYQTQENITIFFIQSKTFSEIGRGGAVCLACTCPQGYMLYVQVDKADVDNLEELGYTVSTNNDLTS